MEKLTKTRTRYGQSPNSETPMDKTSRVVRRMVADEAEERQAKNDRLRKARIEREASARTKQRNTQ